MRKVRVFWCVATVVGTMSVGGAGSALAAAGGDSNSGDVWVDNVGQPSGPGHEMDPHLTCDNINLWGSHLGDSSGTFTIDGWKPSGSGKQAYADTWTYAGPGTQVIAVINVQQLVAQAAANGDKPTKQGYHFKLEFSQDPQKHKTFWVDCPPPPPAGATPGSNTTSGSTPSGGTPGSHARRHHRHLVKPKRHHRVHHRRLKHATRRHAVFTG
jgi:hypothetical protein